MMKHFEIYKEENRYCSFPSLCLNAGGKILLAFRRASSFSHRAAQEGRATHHDPDSTIELVTSSDGAKTWSPGRTLYNGACGVNDPALTLLSDGSILAKFVALDIRPSQEYKHNHRPIFSHRCEHGLVTQVVGNMIMKSEDDGESWQEMGIAGAGGQLEYSCSRDPVIELEDKSLLMSVYTGAPQRSDISWVMRSFDRGRTWGEPVPVLQDDRGRYSQLHGTNYNETALLDLGRGEILAAVRSDEHFHTHGEFMPVGGVGYISLVKSQDGGLCWSQPSEQKIWGQPAALTKLKSGELVLTYGYRKKPFGVRCMISHDNGDSWDAGNEVIIRDDAPSWDVGYPTTIELDDGRILTAYYFIDSDGTRHIAGTIWGL